MRALVLQFLLGDSELADLIPEERWFSGRAMEDSPVGRPFAVLRFGGTFPGIGLVGIDRCEIWVHDEPGSYDRIDTILQLIRDRLHDEVHLSDDDSEIMLATWRGDSPDLFDPALRTNTKSIAFELVGKVR